MRRLRTIVIEGFKTFREPTVVELAEGMTAIVGPNGCGKSNLVDAIAWAVGSRSWKSLRGLDMEDVIYHGGDQAPPASRAIVRLVFENPDRALPIDLEEVEVTREIERKTGMKAYINRVQARVRDLQTLLVGTGLVGGFSLVRQGMVDRLILSPPEDLGRWIEEAADIASFRSKRKESLDRLEKVRTNLARAEEHVERLKKERRKVRERAGRARERAALADRVSILEAQLAYFEREALEGEMAALEARRGSLPAEATQLAGLRETLVAVRMCLEEDLSGDTFMKAGEAEGAAVISTEAAAEKCGRILSTASFLADLSRLMDREGPPGWPKVKPGLSRATEMIQEIQVDAPPNPTSSMDPGETPAKRMRRILREIDALDARRTVVDRELAGLGQEQARLEERRAHLAPSTLPATAPPDGINAAEVRQELGRLEKELALIGPVDETAEAQEKDLTMKIDSAKASLKDLREAQGTLLRFLEEIDVLAAQVFRHTLGAVEKRFKRHFEALFGGGAVRLRLAARAAAGDGEEPVDLQDENHSAPVEIYVKLPGKGESALTLLSGGERSLTGIALILALAAGDQEEGKGGRLLILDEVDAALDQANSVRFAKLVAELSKTHQILCVTHCSPTMGEAARLVGITTGTVAGTTAVYGVNMAAEERWNALRPANAGG